MQNKIVTTVLGPRGNGMKAAVQACVHCGFCLPTCPTYRVLGEEMDSPRGRILLMKGVLEGSLAAEEAQVHIDRCLGCLACETNCPSGVKYGELLTPFRAKRRAEGAVGGHRLRRWLAAMTLPYPNRFRLAIALGRIGKSLPWLVPKTFKPMLDLIPDQLPKAEAALKPKTNFDRKVALLTGCAQKVLAPRINDAANRVLQRCGFDVVTPSTQGCCGALSWHIGDEKSAARFARNNLKAFQLNQIEAVITTAAGCGSGMHEYPMILAGTPDEAAAKSLAKRTIDISAFLAKQEMPPPPPLIRPLRVAYHDACHLGHAQRVRSQPRKLLGMIGNLTLLEVADADLCCGSAGTYNLDQPEIADKLGKRKAAAILATKPDVVALGNIGCEIQIRRYLREAGSEIPVLHTVEILDAAFRGIDPR